MYFPQNMTFQYFFFDTYIGYFLQALPIALIVTIIYGFVKFKKDRKTSLRKKIFSCLFVCYITGFICLTIGLDLMNIIWYKIIYQMNSGHSINWFNGSFDLVLDFINNISSESIGNFLMFLPFGFLYPLSKDNTTYKKTIIMGFITVILIEISQPILGRAFDINDIILNALGIIISTTIFFVIKKTYEQIDSA